MKYKFSLTLDCDNLEERIGPKQANNLLFSISMILGVDRKDISDIALHHITGIENPDNIEIPWYIKKTGRNIFDMSKLQESEIRVINDAIPNKKTLYLYPAPNEYKNRIKYCKRSANGRYVWYYDADHNFLYKATRRGIPDRYGKHYRLFKTI